MVACRYMKYRKMGSVSGGDLSTLNHFDTGLIYFTNLHTSLINA